MANTIARHYTEELTDWERSIAFYSGEIDELTLKLHEVINRNSIPHIAERVEVHQRGLDRVAEKFLRLGNEFDLQRASLKTDGALIDDSLINDTTGTKQEGLRQDMTVAEKECIGVKKDCQLFLSEIYKNRRD